MVRSHSAQRVRTSWGHDREARTDNNLCTSDIKARTHAARRGHPTVRGGLLNDRERTMHKPTPKIPAARETPLVLPPDPPAGSPDFVRRLAPRTLIFLPVHRSLLPRTRWRHQEGMACNHVHEGCGAQAGCGHGDCGHNSAGLFLFCLTWARGA